MRRVFERRGLGYRMNLPELATELAVDRLTRSRGELHGELVVTSGLPGTRSSDGHLHQARFNLSSSEARSRISKALANRANTRDDLDWLDVMEEFCRRVLAAEREGVPPIRVGTLPKPVGVEWRLDPIIPAGKPVVLYGEGGTGKSTLAAALAVSVETGVALIEGIVPRKANVLYLDWESDQDEINDRVRGVAMGANLPAPASILYRACHAPIADVVEDLARIVQAQDIGLVVVDSVGLAAGAGADGGDAAETALRMFSAFRVLEAARPGCAVLAIDHVSKAEAEATNRSARPYGCYAAATEVLTRSGWKTHPELIAGEEVLAFDPHTEQLAWQVPTAHHAYQHDGPMVRLRTNGTHALVTPNHRMLLAADWGPYRARPRRTWGFIQADQVALADWRTPVAGQAIEGGDATHTTDWMRWLGWWISEGSIAGRTGAVISQNVGELADQMAAVTRSVFDGVSVREYARRGGRQVRIRVGDFALVEWLTAEVGSSSWTKRLPGVVFEQDADRRAALLQGLLEGDGHRVSATTSIYTTVSQQLADDIQRLAIGLGYSAIVRARRAAYKGEPRAYLQVSIIARRSTALRWSRVTTTEPYSGLVYCLTLPAGAYVTRLDGVPAIQGNSIYKVNLARAMFELRRGPSVGNRTSLGLYNTKSNVRAPVAPIGLDVLHEEDGSVRYERLDSLPTELSKPLRLPDRVWAVLREGHLDAAEIAELIDEPENKVRATLSRYRDMFQKLPSGKWEALSRAS